MKGIVKSLLLAAVITFVSPPLGMAIDSVVYAASLHPSKYIRGRLTCALNVNRFLRHIGKAGTGSASSLSFLMFKRTSKPMRGDVVFNNRSKYSGHVQIYDGLGLCWNPSSRYQRWIFQPCNSTWGNKHKYYLRSK
jgi:hypothetical protein